MVKMRLSDEKLFDEFIKLFERAGLKLNIRKTKIMYRDDGYKKNMGRLNKPYEIV